MVVQFEVRVRYQERLAYTGGKNQLCRRKELAVSEEGTSCAGGRSQLCRGKTPVVPEEETRSGVRTTTPPCWFINCLVGTSCPMHINDSLLSFETI